LKPPLHYIKHIYWMSKKEKDRLAEDLAAKNIRMKEARGVVCSPLDERNRISCVSPEVWNQTCARQGSWYRASRKNGLHLVVSSFDLAAYGYQEKAIITRSGFIPPAAAGYEEQRDMMAEPEFQDMIPPGWRVSSDKEKEAALRWARRTGSDITDYSLLYLTHTANHANFIKPRFFIREGIDIIPYSIGHSADLCSCCLELFQVLGDGFAKKLVAPCAGAVIFAGLEPDRFLLVEKGQRL
jgi:hypothetical protein